MLGSAIGVGATLILIWLLFPYLEKRMVFSPTREWDMDPREMGISCQEITFETEDGIWLSGLWLESPESEGVVLYAHGNAGNLSHRIPMAESWRRDLGLSVLLFDYRGYGRSLGMPNEPGLLKDIRAAYDQALQLGGEIPIVAGRSLGTVPAIQLAVEQEIRGLLLDSPLVSAERMAPLVLPLPGIHRLLSIQLDNVSAIGGVRCPILILHGEQDRVIPIEQGREVYEAARGARFVLLEGLGHNDPRTTPEILSQIRHFVSVLPRCELSTGCLVKGAVHLNFFGNVD